MKLQCPHCQQRIPRWPWVVTETGGAAVTCARCGSTLRIRRRWKFQIVFVWVGLAALLAVALFRETGLARMMQMHLPMHRSGWRGLFLGIGTLVASLLGTLWIMRYRTEVVALGTRCPHCGYDLRGLDHSRCPECGRGAGDSPPTA